MQPLLDSSSHLYPGVKEVCADNEGPLKDEESCTGSGDVVPWVGQFCASMVPVPPLLHSLAIGFGLDGV